MAPIRAPLSAASAPSAIPMKMSAADDPYGRQWRRAHRLHGYGYSARLSFRQAAAAVSTTSNSFSRRSPIRPSIPIREEMVMSLISYIGRERNILAETPEHCHTLRLEHPILSNRDLEKLRRVSHGRPAHLHPAGSLRRERRQHGTRARPRRSLPPRLARRRIRLHADHHLRPRRRRKLRAHPQPARADRGAQPSGSREDPHPGRAHHRIRRAARSDALRAAHRLRSQRRQPLSRDRDIRRPAISAVCLPEGITAEKAALSLHQVHQQRTAESLLEDGHFDSAKLSRRAGFRSHRTQQGSGRALLYRHAVAH